MVSDHDAQTKTGTHIQSCSFGWDDWFDSCFVPRRMT